MLRPKQMMSFSPFLLGPKRAINWKFRVGEPGFTAKLPLNVNNPRVHTQYKGDKIICRETRRKKRLDLCATGSALWNV